MYSVSWIYFYTVHQSYVLYVGVILSFTNIAMLSNIQVITDICTVNQGFIAVRGTWALINFLRHWTLAHLCFMFHLLVKYSLGSISEVYTSFPLCTTLDSLAALKKRPFDLNCTISCCVRWKIGGFFWRLFFIYTCFVNRDSGTQGIYRPGISQADAYILCTALGGDYIKDVFHL